MLGLADGWVAAAYWLCLASSLICIIYGALNWNKGGEAAVGDEERTWAEHEKQVEEEL
jgi:hypothetical protein